MLGQLGHVELGARSLPRQIVAGDGVQHMLQHPECVLGAAQLVARR